MQILLENALKNNDASVEKPLNVDISVEDEYLVFTNNLAPVASANSTHTGLANIRKRYEYLTGEKGTVLQSEAAFSVKIPLISVKEALGF